MSNWHEKSRTGIGAMHGRVAFAVALVWMVGTCENVFAAVAEEGASESAFTWLRRIVMVMVGLMVFGAMAWRQKREPEELPVAKGNLQDPELAEVPVEAIDAGSRGSLYVRGQVLRRDRRRWPYAVQPLFLAPPAARRSGSGSDRFDRKNVQRRVGIMWG